MNETVRYFMLLRRRSNVGKQDIVALSQTLIKSAIATVY